MNELHLFSGLGGGILGGTLLGHSCVCAVELDAYCRKGLLQRQRDGFLPRFPIWDDVTTFDGIPWRGRAQAVCGGFPCKNVSIAGLGGGLDGDESKLWFEQRRIIGEVGPEYAFVENSPALTFRGGFELLQTLPPWGMTVAGELWELRTPSGLLELRASITSESEYGSLRLRTPLATDGSKQGHGNLPHQLKRLPSPKASDATRGDCKSEMKRRSPFLGSIVKRLPTPRANDPEKWGNFDATNPRNGLPAAIRLMTPCASDADKWNKRSAEERRAQGRQVRLTNQLQAGGVQSPMWTEWFQGFPIGWTALEPLECHRFLSWLRGHGRF